MNTLDNQYLALLDRILEYGVEKSDRTGTGTLSVFGGQFIHDMKDGFPLLTTKRIAVKTMMTELKWFLKGDTNIKYLVDNGCNIWNGDAYKSYLKTAEERNYGDMTLSMEDFVKTIKSNDSFANQFGELGPIYGSQWRQFGVWAPVDQMAELIDGLKNNPDSRRHLVTAWNPEDLYDVVLPPCHYGFQCYVADGELSLMWNQRSVDTFLGLSTLNHTQHYFFYCVKKLDTSQVDLSETLVTSISIRTIWTQFKNNWEGNTIHFQPLNCQTWIS